MPNDTPQTAAQWKQQLVETYTKLHHPEPNPNRPVERNYGAAPWAEKLIERYAPHLRWIKRREFEPKGLNTLPSAVDFGAGKGVFLDLLESRKLIRSGTGVDLIPGRKPWLTQSMWEPLGTKFDVSISTDALEHLPPDLVPQTLRVIAGSAPHGIHRICLRPDKGGAKMTPPRVLHLTLWSPNRWLEEFYKAGIVTRAYYVEMRLVGDGYPYEAIEIFH